jgi:hypothetical protein
MNSAARWWVHIGWADREALGGAIAELDTTAVDYPTLRPIDSPDVEMGASRRLDIPAVFPESGYRWVDLDPLDENRRACSYSAVVFATTWRASQRK